MLRYIGKVFRTDKALDSIADRRTRRQIPTRRIAGSILGMFLGHLGSLNAVARTTGSRGWKLLTEGDRGPPSPDTIGRVAGLLDTDDVRRCLQDTVFTAKRKKMLPAPATGLVMLVIDGHESSASYLRWCPQCLQRQTGTKKKRTQYYHRNVCAMLVGDDWQVFLDMEPQRPGEDEVAAALRLLERVGKQRRRAFDVVNVDALYAVTPVLDRIRSFGKHLLVVLKKNRPELLADAEALFADRPADAVFHQRGRDCRVHDLEGFTTWEGSGAPVRVVHSEETATVLRQKRSEETGERTPESQISDWYWATTLPAALAGTRTLVAMGHRRWAIENEGFNTVVTELQADHVFRHDPVAIEVFWLFALWASNLFEIFWRRNLKKPARPDRRTTRRKLQSAFYKPTMTSEVLIPP